jgi:hypothetical protein
MFNQGNKDDENIGEYTFSEDVPSWIYPGFSINLSKLDI